MVMLPWGPHPKRRRSCNVDMPLGHVRARIGHQRLKEEQQPRRYFTAEQVKALFEVSTGLGYDVALFVRLGVLVGLRKAEILSLRTADVDRESSLIIICDHRPDDGFRPKSRQERRIPSHDELWRWLDEETIGYYSPSRVLHHRYREKFHNEWDLLMLVAVIDFSATPHTMSHTFGTMPDTESDRVWPSAASTPDGVFGCQGNRFRAFARAGKGSLNAQVLDPSLSRRLRSMSDNSDVSDMERARYRGKRRPQGLNEAGEGRAGSANPAAVDLLRTIKKLVGA